MQAGKAYKCFPILNQEVEIVWLMEESIDGDMRMGEEHIWEHGGK